MSYLMIHQPEFLPWTSYLCRYLKSDVRVVLDHVQFSTSSFQHRNRVQVQGSLVTLSLRIGVKRLPLRETFVDIDSSWSKILRQLEGAYKKAPNFKRLYEILEYPPESPTLSDINEEILDRIVSYLGVCRPETVYSSQLPTDLLRYKRSDLVKSIYDYVSDLRGEKCDLLTGPSTYEYLTADDLVTSMRVANVKYRPDVTYSQYRCKKFVPRLSILDLLMTNTIEESLDYIERSNEIVTM